MTDSPEALVFDTGPLRHFAVEGWLGVLHFLAGNRPVVIPDSVEAELRRQSHEVPVLKQVLDADWITVDRSTDLAYMVSFAAFADRLVEGGRNTGECGVLALGKVRGFEIVLDDAVPRQIAHDEGIRVTATLPLLCKAIRDGQLTLPMVESLADDLISGEYFLPFEQGGFRQWAVGEGLIDY